RPTPRDLFVPPCAPGTRSAGCARRRIDGRVDAGLPRLDVSQLRRRRRRPPRNSHTPTMNALFEAPQQQPPSLLLLSSLVDPPSSLPHPSFCWRRGGGA